MELTHEEVRKILRQGRANLYFHTRLPAPAEGIEPLYALLTEGAAALEDWAKKRLLPALEQAILHSPRKARLYATPPSLRFTIQGEWADDRYLSLSLTLELAGDRVTPRSQHNWRVWDVKRANFCPIDWFLPPQEAARCQRWTFRLDGDRVLGFPRRGKQRADRPCPVGKRQNFAPAS